MCPYDYDDLLFKHIDLGIKSAFRHGLKHEKSLVVRIVSIISKRCIMRRLEIFV